jgi:hypothetical protein
MDAQDLSGAADVDEAPSQRCDECVDQGLRITRGAFKERRGETQERVRVTADLGRRWGEGRWVAARLARELADVRPALQVEAIAAAGRGGDDTHYISAITTARLRFVRCSPLAGVDSLAADFGPG